MRSHRILIVDDNDLARRVMKTMVLSQGWEVCAEARDGPEALEMIQTYTPDLVILDFMMPEQDGLQTAREILKIRPSLPIVMNTLYLTDQLCDVAESIGVRQVVSKSNYRVLIKVLNSELTGLGDTQN